MALYAYARREFLMQLPWEGTASIPRGRPQPIERGDPSQQRARRTHALTLSVAFAAETNRPA